ncbi:MAG: hypothetical protein ACKVHE_19325 [Planctomycetales bacterium]|jgi:hypothetical protein
MRFLTPTRVMLAIVAMLGIFVMLGFFSVMKTLDAIEQPKLTFQREGFETRTIPIAVTTLKPRMVVRKDDLGKSRWPVREIRGDIILSERLIVGCVVQKEIASATPIHAASLKRLGEFSKEYVGVPRFLRADSEYPSREYRIAIIGECVFTLSLAGWSASQGRGGPSPRLRPRLSLWESIGICPSGVCRFSILISRNQY